MNGTDFWESETVKPEDRSLGWLMDQIDNAISDGHTYDSYWATSTNEEKTETKLVLWRKA